MVEAYSSSNSAGTNLHPMTMSETIDPNDEPVATIDTTAPTFDERYSSVAVDHEETIIYDREVEEAWIQADNVLALSEAA